MIELIFKENDFLLTLECEYIRLSDEWKDGLNYLYIYGVKKLNDNSIKSIDSEKCLKLYVNIFNEGGVPVKFCLIQCRLHNDCLVKENMFMVVEVDHDFLEESDYEYDVYRTYYYDQDQLDIFYLWDNDKTGLFLEKFKHQYAYSRACHLYSGYPPKKMLNKHIVIDGAAISSIYHFYNLLAERFFGFRAYIGTNLDVLYEGFLEMYTYIDFENSTIKIENASVLNDTFNAYRSDYLKDFIEVMSEFRINVELN